MWWWYDIIYVSLGVRWQWARVGNAIVIVLGRGRYGGKLGVGHIQGYWICYLKVVPLFGPWHPPLVSGDQFLSGPGLSLKVLNVRLVYN